MKFDWKMKIYYVFHKAVARGGTTGACAPPFSKTKKNNNKIFPL